MQAPIVRFVTRTVRNERTVSATRNGSVCSAEYILWVINTAWVPRVEVCVHNVAGGTSETKTDFALVLGITTTNKSTYLIVSNLLTLYRYLQRTAAPPKTVLNRQVLLVLVHSS